MGRHEEDVEVYVNGVLAGSAQGVHNDRYFSMALRPEAVTVLKVGDNTLAVHCHQTVGGQIMDVGLEATGE